MFWGQTLHGHLEVPMSRSGTQLDSSTCSPVVSQRLQTLQHWWLDLDWTLSLYKWFKQGALSQRFMNSGANKWGGGGGATARKIKKYQRFAKKAPAFY